MSCYHLDHSLKMVLISMWLQSYIVALTNLFPHRTSAVIAVPEGARVRAMLMVETGNEMDLSLNTVPDLATTFAIGLQARKALIAFCCNWLCSSF
jgi:hypothetical protein